MAGKRSIFEEVAEGATPAPVPAGGLIDARSQGARRGIRLWLVAIFLLVAAMIAVGGLTRLSEAGLSITEWKPITGALPPMNAADWATEFEKYKATPQFALMNSQMTLEEFKSIFWWEWGHRQLGRLIGLVWAAGFLGFLIAGRIPNGWKGRLLGLGALGGLQGAVGWWMVSSGLEGQMVSVASYRLAVHLGLGFAILGLTAWYALALGRSETALMQARRAGERRLQGMATGLMHLAFVQVLLGALVAGIDAGRAFPTWPDMNGSFFPADAFYLPGGGGLWRAFFENPGLVQFDHRIVGYLLVAFGLAAAFAARRSPHAATRRAFLAVAAMMLAQMVLGIFTALTAAHLHVAITHQIGAILLWVLILRARHLSIYPVQGSIREGTA
jgi:cytochrome c oxidase assembly protein subunit 15